MDEVQIDFEVTDPGQLVEIHRNVTVEVVEHQDGSISYGWKRQENTISEYIIPEDSQM